MANSTIRWNLVISPETDRALRQFLAANGAGRKGDLSRFVEEAVQARILELSAQSAKERNSQVSPATMEQAIDEALSWAR